jgi:hypothetical protein
VRIVPLHQRQVLKVAKCNIVKRKWSRVYFVEAGYVGKVSRWLRRQDPRLRANDQQASQVGRPRPVKQQFGHNSDRPQFFAKPVFDFSQLANVFAPTTQCLK